MSILVRYYSASKLQLSISHNRKAVLVRLAKCTITILSICFCSYLPAQVTSKNEIIYTVDIDELSLPAAINELETVTGHLITLKGNYPDDESHTLSMSDTLDSILKTLLLNNNYYVLSKGIEKTILVVGRKSDALQLLGNRTLKNHNLNDNNLNIVSIPQGFDPYLKAGDYELSITNDGEEELIPVEIMPNIRDGDIEITYTADGYEEIIPKTVMRTKTIQDGSYEYSYTSEGFEEIIPVVTLDSQNSSNDGNFEYSYTSEGYEEIIPY